MSSIFVIIILAVVTILSFIFFKPRKRPPLGYGFWNAQSISGHDLARMFATNNEVDRLVEMLYLDSTLVPEAKSFQSSAAAVGIPALFRRFSVPVPDTEEIIKGLLGALQDVPGDVIYAMSVLGVGQYLGSLEDEVVLALIEQLSRSGENPKNLVKVCDALGYIGNKLAVEPLENMLENKLPQEVQNAASKAHSRLEVTQ
jgi:hypothetical protein